MTVKCNGFPDGKKILSIISSMFRLKEIVDIILIIFWKRFFLIAAIKLSELLEGLSPMLGSWWCDWVIDYICSFDWNFSLCKITSPFCLLLVLCLISAMRIKTGSFPSTKNICNISVAWEKNSIHIYLDTFLSALNISVACFLGSLTSFPIRNEKGDPFTSIPWR